MAQFGAHLGFDFLELVYVRVQVTTLTLEVGDVQPAAAQKLAHLLQAGAVYLIEVEQFSNLCELETKPLTAANPAQPRAVAGTVEPGQALTAWLDQALVFVEADGAWRDRELA